MTTNGMETVDDFLGPRLGLRSSRVTSSSTYGDQDEREQLIPSSDDNNYRNEFKKSQGRSWKAKREDSDEDLYNYSKNENGSSIPLQRIKGKTQPKGKHYYLNLIRNYTKPLCFLVPKKLT